MNGVECLLEDGLTADGLNPRTRTAGGPMQLSILGPMQAFRNGDQVTPSARKVRHLLAVLLARSGSVVPVEVLIDELWGERPPRTVVQALRVYVSHLRQLVAPSQGGCGSPVLVTQTPGYRLELNGAVLDATVFRELCDRAWREQKEGELQRALELYTRALDLWRGAALADVDCGPLLGAMATWLEETRSVAVERRIDVELDLGRHHQLVPELSSMVIVQPLNERLHARLMIALYRSGRPREALALFARLRSCLIDELGVEPSPNIQTVHRAVLCSDDFTLHGAVVRN